MSEIAKYREVEQFMKKMGYAISEVLEDEGLEGFGYAFLLFEFGNAGIGNYISNANRGDMVKALRETADRLEAKQDLPPAEGPTQ